jgi:FtsZ-binding cell division protein ZapB
MLQGYGDTVLRAEALEEQLAKARKHSAMLQSKLDDAFAQYHNEVQDMQAKSDELVRKNKSLRSKNKGTVLSCRVPIADVLQWSNPALLIAELETRVEQLKASEVDMKNLFYREKEAREVLEYDYKQLAYECDKHMELRIA